MRDEDGTWGKSLPGKEPQVLVREGEEEEEPGAMEGQGRRPLQGGGGGDIRSQGRQGPRRAPGVGSGGLLQM